MPLSEEELRLLEQMEQALAQEDPKFVSTLRGSSLERTARLRAIGAGVVFALGIALLMSGAIAQQIWLGVLGFVVMLASATTGLASWRGRHSSVTAPRAADAAFDFDDHPQRFDVIDGGKRDRPRRTKRQAERPQRPAARSPKQGTFMQRMEQRWERRRHNGF